MNRLLAMALSAFLVFTVAGFAEIKLAADRGSAVQSINPLRLALRQKQYFSLPDGTAYTAAEAAFFDLVAGRKPALKTLRAAGLSLHLADGEWSALADHESDPQGRGLYAYRPDGRDLLISAPHQFRDLRTGDIAGSLFDELQLGAAAFNTAPRDLPVGNDRLSDLGKLESTEFTLFHLVYHAHRPGARIVQLHGFAAEKRRSASARAVEVIVSNGTRRPDAGTRAIVACLSGAGLKAAIYPDDVGELGGTTNAVLAALMDAGAPVGTFVHVETSRDLRDRLSVDAALRFVFGSCLSAGP